MTTAFRRGSRAQRLARRRRGDTPPRPRRGARRDVVAILVMSAMSGAIAYWRAGGPGTGVGAVTGLAAPTNAAGSASGTTVHVAWTGVTAPGAGTFGYYVQRFSSADGFTTPSSLRAPARARQRLPLPAAPTSCDDNAVAAGTYRYRVVAVFRSWAATSALSATVTVFALDHFVVSTSTSAVAGTSLTARSRRRTAANATITNYSGMIHFTSSDGAATLPATYTFVPGDSGVHAFTNGVVLKTAGSQSWASMTSPSRPRPAARR